MTVSTYLSHLVQKEFLRMDRNGKIYSYHPIVKAQEYMKYDVQNVVSSGLTTGGDDG
ncbi:MAG: BlaI/MecI/CopY family transcriptional regulator [Eubacterium sp.]